jgi:hypothetical protein
MVLVSVLAGCGAPSAPDPDPASESGSKADHSSDRNPSLGTSLYFQFLDSRCPQCDQALAKTEFTDVGGPTCQLIKAPLWYGAGVQAGFATPNTAIHVQMYLGRSAENPNATIDLCNFPTGGDPNYKAFSVIDEAISLASLSSTVGKNLVTGMPENQIFMLCDADRSPACFAH